MAHATMLKFGYPDTLLHEGEHWALLVRPAQVTLGSLVLCATSDAASYADLPPDAFVEQRDMVGRAERLLRQAVDYERINYLMLMMVDPHVHFHVFPRYSGSRHLAGLTLVDSGWPGLPALHDSTSLPASLLEALKKLFHQKL